MERELASPASAPEAVGQGGEPGLEIVRGAPEPLLAWLDDGLRDGRRGRLAAEYGLGTPLGDDDEHVVARLGGRPVAHALIRRLEARADRRRLPITRARSE